MKNLFVRRLAAVLCASMLFTSNGVTALAATLDSPAVEYAAEESEATEETSIEVTPAEETGGAEVTPASETGEGETTPAGDDESAGETTPAEGGETVTPTDGENAPVDGETTPAEGAVTEGETETAEEITEEATEEIAVEEDALTDEEVALEETAEDIDELGAINNQYLEVVSENGLLKVKDGVDVSTATTVYIPNSCITIPDNFFKSFSNVRTITFEALNDPANKPKLTTIGAGAFEGRMISEFHIPAGVTSISANTFKDCTELKEIKGGDNVTSVGEEAFYGCSKLGIEKSFDLTAVTTIGNRAFMGCSSLNALTLTALNTIGAEAFSACSKLGKFTFSENITYIGDKAFAGTKLTKVDLSKMGSADNAEFMGISVFEGCSYITTVKLSPYQKVIPKSTFKGCTSLATVDIPSGMLGLDESAFEGCEALKSIAFPATVYNLSANSLGGCTNLATITILYPEEETRLHIDSTAFASRSERTVIRGYNELLIEEAIKNLKYSKNYYFERIETIRNIKLDTIKNGKIVICDSASGKEVSQLSNQLPAGRKVLLKVTPNENYTIVDKGLWFEYGSTTGYPVYESTSETGEMHFTFTMPDEDTTVKAHFVATDKAVTGKLSYSLEDKVGYSFALNENYATVKEAGSTAQLKLYSEETVDGVKQSVAVAPWLITYQSSATGVAEIDKNGVITTLGIGETTITATLKINTTKSISFKLNVGSAPVIQNIGLSFTNKPAGMTEKHVLATEDEPETWILTIPSQRLVDVENKNPEKTLTVNVTEKDLSGTAVVTSTKWTSVDKTVATVPATVRATSNVVTLKRNSEGETTITVSVTNSDGALTAAFAEGKIDAEQKKALKTVSKKFIVRVVDATPRLVETKVTVNTKSSTGTKIGLVSVYDGTIGHIDAIYKKNSNGGFEIVDTVIYCENTPTGFYLKAAPGIKSSLAEGATKTYKGADQLYISGKLSDGTDFYTPIPELVLVNNALKPTLKSSGKINLFYNSTALPSEAGYITVKQSLTKETLEKVEFDTSDNNGIKLDKYFKTEVDREENCFYISRSDTDYDPTVEKLATSGYVNLYYKGYLDPVRMKITIATTTVAPKFALSLSPTKFTTATATLNSLYINKEYQLYVYNKTDKKFVDLSELDPADGLSFDDTKTTLSVERLNIADAQYNNYISLKIEGKPTKGKAVINVQKSTWNNYVPLTFNLKVTSANAKAVLSKNSVTLNKRLPSQLGVIGVTLNQNAATLTGLEVYNTYAEGSVKEEAASHIGISAERISDDYGEIRVSLNDTDIPNGTYVFKVRPSYEYNGVQVLDSIPVATLKVVVKDVAPSIKLKKSSVTLNAYCPGLEVVSTNYSINNFPTGADYSLALGEITPKKDTDYAAANMLSHLTFSSAEPGVIAVSLDSSVAVNKSFSYKYVVHSSVLSTAYGNVELADFSLTVKGNVNKPVITLKTSGTLNTINPESSVKCVATIKNINSQIANVSIQEYNDKGTRYPTGSVTVADPHFEIVSSDNLKTFYIRAKDGVKLDSKTKYRLALKITLTADPGKTYDSKIITIKPKQTFPKLTTILSANSLFAGQAQEDRYITVLVQPTTVKGCSINGVEFDKSTPNAVKNAYVLSWNGIGPKLDSEGNPVKDKNGDIVYVGYVKVILKDPSKVVANQKYTLSIVTKYNNQMTNTTGPIIKVPITVRK